MPRVFSISYSTGRPWVSQPKRLSTLFPLHGLVTGKNIFDGAGDEVTEVWEAGGEGGAVVKNVIFCPFPVVYGFLENRTILPERENVLFHLGEIHFGIDIFEQGRPPKWCLGKEKSREGVIVLPI
jgi:hypothetical protein